MFGTGAESLTSFFFFSSRRRHTRLQGDWSSDVCSSDLMSATDPRDDGYSEGDVYPQGGWRPPGGVQRGSVADMPIYPGDPLTPGVGEIGRASCRERV